MWICMRAGLCGDGEWVGGKLWEGLRQEEDGGWDVRLYFRQLGTISS